MFYSSISLDSRYFVPGMWNVGHHLFLQAGVEASIGEHLHTGLGKYYRWLSVRNGRRNWGIWNSYFGHYWGGTRKFHWKGYLGNRGYWIPLEQCRVTIPFWDLAGFWSALAGKIRKRVSGDGVKFVEPGVKRVFSFWRPPLYSGKESGLNRERDLRATIAVCERENTAGFNF